jgi:hypothetical protein
MSIAIWVETVIEKENITIETPFYYKHDLMIDDCDSVTYGKIMDTCVVSVSKTDRYLDHEITFEFEIDERPRFQGYTAYMVDEEYKSSKEEYEAAVAEMQQFISDNS